MNSGREILAFCHETKMSIRKQRQDGKKGQFADCLSLPTIIGNIESKLYRDAGEP